MDFITESELSWYRSQTKTFSKESRHKDITKPMIFLSHKHDEYDILQGVIAFLKEEGVDIYVDWMDKEMPDYTNAETAIRLKERIKTSNKFIFVATQNAINSKWCNWELGLGDATKYIEHIALLPIKKSFQAFFNGSEYLKIYPYIKYEHGNSKYTNGHIYSKRILCKKTFTWWWFKINSFEGMAKFTIII